MNIHILEKQMVEREEKALLTLELYPCPKLQFRLNAFLCCYELIEFYFANMQVCNMSYHEKRRKSTVNLRTLSCGAHHLHALNLIWLMLLYWLHY